MTGEEEVFQVYVSPDGRISYPKQKEFGSSGADDTISADPSACSDGAYALLGEEWFGTTYKWYIGDGGLPGALSVAEAKMAFTDAINNITSGYNDCGISANFSGNHQYMGTTTYEADISADGDCTTPDEENTWDAGDLLSTAVATTCYWYEPSGQATPLIVEADVRYNTHDFNFSDNPSTCASQYDVRAVGTHEAGHVFGLGHVGSGHSSQTMFTTSYYCKTAPRTLGKGDMAGLQALY